MKIIAKLIFSLCLLCFIACDNINSLHEQYLERGEGIYTGVIDSLKAFPGNNRIKMTWEINADPRITQTVIYWADRTDSLVIDVNRLKPGVMLMEAIFDIPEGSYIFEIITKDDFGNKSLYVQKTVEVYGDKFIAQLKSRRIASFSAVTNNTVTINWLTVEDLTLLHTTVQYKDYTNPLNPVIKTVKVENKELKTQLSGIKAGEKITVISSFLPVAEALDVTDALPKLYDLPMN